MGLGCGFSIPTLASPGSSPCCLIRVFHGSLPARGPALLHLHREAWVRNALTPWLCLLLLPSHWWSHPGVVPGCCQGCQEGTGNAQPCLPSARCDRAGVRWHRMKPLLPSHVSSFPILCMCCPDLCLYRTGRSLSPQAEHPHRPCLRARGGCLPLWDSCPLVMAGPSMTCCLGWGLKSI